MRNAPEKYNNMGYFNLARGIGMVLILAGHSLVPFLTPSEVSGDPGLFSGTGSVIGGGIMAMFFMISGFGFYVRSPKRCFRIQSRLLLKPYYALVAVTIACRSLLTIVRRRPFWETMKGFLLNLILGVNAENSDALFGGSVQSVTIMWFILALFGGWIIYNSICRVKDPAMHNLLMLICVVLGWALTLISKVWPFCIPMALQAAGYLAAGYELKRQGLLTKRLPWKAWICMLVIIVLSCAFGGVDIGAGVWKLGLIDVAATFCISYIVLKLYAAFMELELHHPILQTLERIGNRSIWVVFLHAFEKTIFPWYRLRGLLPGAPYLSALICLIFRAFMIWAMYRILTRFSHIRKKNRKQKITLNFERIHMLDHIQLKNMPQLLSHLRNQPSDRILLKYMDGMQVNTCSSGDFFRSVDACTADLHSRGLSGKHVGIIGANRPQWLAHLCACFQTGAVPVLLSPDLSWDELTQRIRQTDIQCILFDSSLSEFVQKAADLTEISCISMDRYLPEETPVSLLCPELKPEDPGCILFTSGSTAEPKAVVLSQKALVAGICHNVIGQTFRSQLAILPMHHLAGFATVLNSWYLGRELCMGSDYKYLFRYLEHMKPDYTSVVPSMLQAILRKLRKGGPNGHLLGWDLHYIGCGGAYFPPDVMEALQERNIRVFQGYGASEMGSIGFICEMKPKQDPSCIGTPPAGMKVKIVDQELWIQSPSLMTGYYRDPEGTFQALHDGWYRTGDLAYLNKDGAICLTGRKKDVIILSNGENVSPEEIESYLSQSSAIEEVIVGAQDDRIAAWIYPSDPSEETKAQIRLFIDAYNHQAPTYKQVHVLHYLDAPIPKNETGKPLRRRVTGEKEHDFTGTEKNDH